jgi:hypothetical protein
MIELSEIQLYYNVQVYFARNLLNKLPMDSKVWIAEFERFLKDQGCEIHRPSTQLLRNSLGFAPGYDTFRFANEEDAIMFKLKYS